MADISNRSNRPSGRRSADGLDHEPSLGERGQGSVLPLAVWPVAQTTLAEQRADRYLATTIDPGELMPPVLAARIVTTYSRPGQTVCDPMCGTGTVLAEAIRASRQITGADLDPARVRTAALNVAIARLTTAPDQPTTPTDVVVDLRHADARSIEQLVTDGSAPSLVVLHPPRPDARSTGHTNDPDMAALGEQAYWDALRDVAAGAHAITPPDGHLVIVVRGYQRGGQHIDSAAAAVAAAQQAGWTYRQHVVAVLAPLRGDRLHVPRPPEQPIARWRLPLHQVVHDDVLAFTTGPRTPVDPCDDRRTDPPAGSHTAAGRSPNTGATGQQSAGRDGAGEVAGDA